MLEREGVVLVGASVQRDVLVIVADIQRARPVLLRSEVCQHRLARHVYACLPHACMRWHDTQGNTLILSSTRSEYARSGLSFSEGGEVVTPYIEGSLTLTMRKTNPKNRSST